MQYAVSTYLIPGTSQDLGRDDKRGSWKNKVKVKVKKSEVIQPNDSNSRWP